MEIVESKKIPFDTDNESLEKISAYMDQLPRQAVDKLLWLKVTDKPAVAIAIAHNESAIYLKYWVDEKFVKTDYKKANDPVYKDSCVEFFFAPGNDPGYYNLEFNSAGIALVQYGADRHNRAFLPSDVVDLIRVYASDQTLSNLSGYKHWELTVQIPFKLFLHHKINDLANTTAKVNFFKCGDELPEPHYLSWNHIPVTEPDFHLPEYFGLMKFI